LKSGFKLEKRLKNMSVANTEKCNRQNIRSAIGSLEVPLQTQRSATIEELAEQFLSRKRGILC
jgi:hypothetical protein